jgi:hypothetical protein
MALRTHLTDRRRDAVNRAVTRLLAVSLTPVAALVTPGRARHTACQWALGMRFPAEDLAGLTPATRAAFEAARARALCRHGELLGLTCGYRDAATQTAGAPGHRADAQSGRISGMNERAARWWSGYLAAADRVHAAAARSTSGPARRYAATTSTSATTATVTSLTSATSVDVGR